MKCIYCKASGSASNSVEHIIPESLGNEDILLPKGAVCDACNNYLAREIEKPVLDREYFKQVRQRFKIKSKKGKIPSIKGYHAQSGLVIDLGFKDGSRFVSAALEKEEAKFIRALQGAKTGSFYIPHLETPQSDRVLSRFIAKIAYGYFAHRVSSYEGWNEEFVQKSELNEIRRFIRIGDVPKDWPIHIRRIYDENKFFEDGDDRFHLINELDILVTKNSEYYGIVALFGIEYVINLGGPELDGYMKWLEENGGKSPLYAREKDADTGQ